MSNDYIINLHTQRRLKRRLIKLILLLVALSVLYIIFNYFLTLSQGSAKFISPNKSSPKVSKSLEEVVHKSLDGVEGTYAIVIKNLNSNEAYYLSEEKVFEAGSLYKLWVLAEVTRQIQQGLLKEDEILSEDVKVLNSIFSIDPGLAELQSGTITLTLDQALTQMITISHNYAALLLTQKLKLSSIKAFLEKEGFNQSTVGTDGESPTTTAHDIALFFEKLYKGELANPQYSQKILDLLKRQNLNQKIPKYLPAETQVAHKTGEIGWFNHDAGIVFTNKGDYIIVVLSETKSPQGAEEKIANLSKAVYEYFEKSNP